MSTTTGGILNASADKKNVKPAEFIWYLIAVFFYTNMTGFVGQYRNVFLVDVVQISNKQSSLFNVITSIVPYILNFFIVMYIDGRNIGKKGKFRPLIMLAAIPMGILLFLSFWVPKGISGALLMIYIITVAILWSVMNTFGGTINNLAVVMTPNLKERDTIMSFRGIVSAVGNSASLVIIVVLNIIWKDNQALQFIVCAAMSGVLGIITMLTGMNIARERITYDNEKKNPIAGFGDILKNKYAWTIIISEFLKSFRSIANFMGPFLAAALLGSSSKFLLFGLPTGIGTAVGMLIINFLLKNSIHAHSILPAVSIRLSPTQRRLLSDIHTLSRKRAADRYRLCLSYSCSLSDCSSVLPICCLICSRQMSLRILNSRQASALILRCRLLSVYSL